MSEDILRGHTAPVNTSGVSSGKANLVDTLVPVADRRGYIKLGDVLPGDYVFDENGMPAQVLGVFPQGELGAYKIMFSGGYEIICNDEHLWNARTDSDILHGRDYRTMSLRDMMDSGDLYYIPKAKPASRGERRFTENTLAFFNRLEADGPGDACDIKFIPDEVYLGSIAQREDLLRALFDRFGQVYMKWDVAVYQIRVGNNILAEGIRRLASTLGIATYLNYAGGVYTLVLDVSHDIIERLFSVTTCYAAARGMQIASDMAGVCESDLAIVSITDLNCKMDMACIYVESGAHLFQISEHHIVTHNMVLA